MHALAACAAVRSPALCNIDITRNKLAFYGELFSFFPVVATLCVISIADTRPVILEIIFFALALFFPFVAALRVVVTASARPAPRRRGNSH